MKPILSWQFQKVYFGSRIFSYYLQGCENEKPNCYTKNSQNRKRNDIFIFYSTYKNYKQNIYNMNFKFFHLYIVGTNF